MTVQENQLQIIEILQGKKFNKTEVSRNTGISRIKIYNVIQGKGYFNPKEIDLLNKHLGICHQ